VLSYIAGLEFAVEHLREKWRLLQLEAADFRPLVESVFQRRQRLSGRSNVQLQFELGCEYSLRANPWRGAAWLSKALPPVPG